MTLPADWQPMRKPAAYPEASEDYRYDQRLVGSAGLLPPLLSKPLGRHNPHK